MPLTPATRLSCYEILAPLGAGGVGEVNCARDTRLRRFRVTGGAYTERDSGLMEVKTSPACARSTTTRGGTGS